MHGQVERESSIKNLAILNKTLRRKWCSRFVCERNALWKQVNVGKYMQEEEDRCTREVTETYGVGVWKAIKGGWEVFKGRTSFKVGFGSRVKF